MLCSAQKTSAERSQGHGSVMLFPPGNRRKTCPSVTNKPFDSAALDIEGILMLGQS